MIAAAKLIFAAADRGEAVRRHAEFQERFATTAPKACACLEAAFEDALAVMVLPEKYRRRLRSTNMQERLNEKIRRRERVISDLSERGISDSAIRMVGVLLSETNDDWQERAYFDMSEFHEWKASASPPLVISWNDSPFGDHTAGHVSDDNPYSEAQFKKMKYAADSPDRFGCFEDTVAHTRSLITYYNTEHRHSGIAMLTPAEVHAGTGPDRLAQRHDVMRAAFGNHPERFVNGQPKRQSLPEAVWINLPSDDFRAA